MAGMKFSVFLAAGLPLVAPLSAAVKSGHASADLVAGVSSYEAGKPFQVAIRLTVDPGWHTYWINPGVGGMPVKATWTLPEGWKAGELVYPEPERTLMFQIKAQGFDRDVMLRTEITPPADLRPGDPITLGLENGGEVTVTLGVSPDQ